MIYGKLEEELTFFKMNTLNKKLLIIPFILVFLAMLVSAASVTTSLFYDSTTSNSLTITNGQSAGIIVSADSLFESSMTIKLNLLDSSGSLVNNLLDIYTTRDSYSNYFILRPTAYVNPGSYTIVSTVTAASGQTATAILNLEVLPVTSGNNAPVITSAPVTSVNETIIYSYQVTATDTDGDALTYSLTQNPAWLSINSATGAITGTAPDVAADTNYAVTVSVSDGLAFVTQTFNLVVRETGIIIPPDTTPPVINIISPTNGTTYTSQITSINFTATDTNLASCWYTLDNGLTNFGIPCNTLITGITSVNGINTWTIYANDFSGNIASQTVTFTVNTSANIAPVITSTPVLQINEGTIYNYQVTATDADNNVLTYSLTSAPGWLSINPTTGLITGTAPSVTADEDYRIIVSVSDGVESVTQIYILTVDNVSSSGGTGGGKSKKAIVTGTNANTDFENQQYFNQFTTKKPIEEEQPTTVTATGISFFGIVLIILGIAIISLLVFLLIGWLGLAISLFWRIIIVFVIAILILLIFF